MNIVLGVTGGIAVYKAVLLARNLIEAGHTVHVVPTEDALKFVGKPTWEAISRNPVTTSVHEDVPEVRHVALGQQADLIIIAPATANTIAKMTAGIADDLLGTTLLATRAPVLIAPAMHTEMWENASTQSNIATLKQRGIHMIGPESGRLTGNDSGPGRMSEPEQIFEKAMTLLNPRQDLAGIKFLVTAGGTREAIDPVRYIGNRSSGRQGVALAVAAAKRGARVELVSANIMPDVLADAKKLSTINITEVSDTKDLQQVTNRLAETANVVCMVAAVSDYRVADISDSKLRKEESADGSLTLRLVENPDILKGLTENRRDPKQIIVGFAAETGDSEDEILAYGKKKAARKKADLLAVNAVSWQEGFESLSNQLFILARDGSERARVSGTKTEVAEVLLDEVLFALS